MQNVFSAAVTKLLEFLLDLVVALFIVGRYVICCVTFSAVPGAELAFSSGHSLYSVNSVAIIAKNFNKSS